jgi:hypothetical protein
MNYPTDTSVTDSIVNHTDSWRTVFYLLTPYIYDDRPGQEGEVLCGPGKDRFLELNVNPTPRISTSLEDTILCDGDRAFFPITNHVTTYPGTKVVYDLDVDYAPGEVAAAPITPDGDLDPQQHG